MEKINIFCFGFGQVAKGFIKKINFEKKFKKYENGLTLRVNCSERLAPMIQKIYTIERLNQSLQHTKKSFLF